MDGTGKTTLALKLGEYLRKNHYEVEVIHGHQYTTAKKSFNTSENQVRRYRLFFSLLTPFAYLDNLLTYFKKYRPSNQQKIVISDRYFYDKVSRMLFYGILNKWFASIYLKLLPKPDYVFFLDINEQIAWQRKKEYAIEEYRRFRQMYLYIARQLNACLISTNETVDDTVKKIIAKINLQHE